MHKLFYFGVFLSFLVFLPSIVFACRPPHLYVHQLEQYKDNPENAPEELKPIVKEYMMDREYVFEIGTLDCGYWHRNEHEMERAGMNRDILSAILNKWKVYEE